MSWGFAPLLPAAPLLALVSYSLAADTGVFDVAGVDAGVAKTGYSLVAEVGGFTHTGSDTGFTVAALPPLIKDISFITSGSMNGTTSATLLNNVAFLSYLTGSAAADDLVVVFCETNGADVTPPVGWSAVPGTPVVATNTKLSGFYRLYAPDILNAGGILFTTSADHIMVSGLAFRGVDRESTFAAYSTATQNTASSAVSWAGISTTRDKSWLVHALSHGLDIATPNLGALTLSGVSSISERVDVSTTGGDGGGVAVVTSYAATAGTFGTATATLTTASEQALLTLALNPQQYTGLVLNANSTTLTPQTSGTFSGFGSVRYLAGRYYALETSSRTQNAHSTDGVNWTLFQISSSGAANDLACNDSSTVFVCAPENPTSIFRSTDGLNFSLVAHGMSSFAAPRAVTFGAGLFVLVGVSGVIGTSPDGLTWTRRTSGVTTKLNSIIWTGSQFVAVGNSGVVLTSPDGVTWTRQNNISVSSPTISSVAFSGSTYVAAYNNNNYVLVSSDAVNWTTNTANFAIPSSTSIRVNWTGSQFVLTAASGGLATSPDGNVWTVVSTGTTTNITGSAVNGDQMVLVGASGSIWTTPVPALSQASVQSSLDSGPRVNRLYAGNGLSELSRAYNSNSAPTLAKAASNGTGVWVVPRNTASTGYEVSTDSGKTFVSATASVSATRKASAYGAGVFVFVGTSGFIESSPSGLTGTWTTCTSGTTNAFSDLIYANGQFVAVGAGGSVCVSTDGSTWSHNLTGFGTGLQSVIWDGTQYMASSSSSYATYVSVDGVTWTAGPNIFSASSVYYNLSYGNGVYIAAPLNSNGIRYSTDGSTWNFAGLPDTLTTIGYGVFTGKKHIIPRNSSAGIIYTTEDGINFAQYVVSNVGAFTAAATDGNGNILLTASSGVIWTAKDEAFQSEFKSVGHDAFFTNVVSYQFSAEQGAYLATGLDSNLLFSRWLASEQGSYTQANQAATLSYGRTLPVEVSGFTFTGQAAGTYHSKVVQASAAGFSTAYLDAGFAFGFGLVANAGAYSLSGVSAQTLVGRQVAASTQGIAWTGWDSNVLYGRNLLAALSTAAVSGQPLNLYTSRYVLGGTGSVSTTGQAAQTLVGRWVLADASGYSLSGQAANVLRTAIVGAGQGSYQAQAQDATPYAGRWVQSDTGSIIHSGTDTPVLANRQLPVSQGVHTLGLQANNLYAGRQVTASASPVVVNPFDSGLHATRWLGVSAGGFTSSWFDGAFTTGFGLVANPGMFSLSATEVQWAWQRVLTGQAVNFNHAVYQASLLTARQLPVESVSYSIGFQPTTLAYGRKVSTTTGLYSLEAALMSLGRSYWTSVDVAAYALTGYDIQANKTIFFGVQPGLFQILGYSSQPFFSALQPAKDVALRAQELRSATRPHESNVTIRRADGSVAVHPAEDVSSFVMPHDPAQLGEENRITYH